MLAMPAKPSRVVGTRPEQAHRREVGGRLEAEAPEQDGVGNEAQEVGQVDRAARGPIGGRLDDPGGRSRERGQLRVELRLPAEREQRDATLGTRPSEDVERRLPRRPALVEPNQHGSHAVQRRRRRAGVEPDTAVSPHRREPSGERLYGRPQREQLQVVVGDDEDHRSEQSSHRAPLAAEVFHHRQQVVRR
jgi:hypothetical protein